MKSIVEEYLDRNCINMPVCQNIDVANIFYKTNRCYWRLLNIRQVYKKYHPNYYEFKIMKLKSGSASFFIRTLRSETVHWDDYELKIIKWASQLKKENVYSREEAVTAAWEMVLANSGSLIKSFANDDSFYSTIDESLSDEVRMRNIGKFILQLSGRFGHRHSLVYIWEKEIMGIIRHYGDWLAEIAKHYGK